MKLPWDKRYIKVAFHVVVTVILIYVSVMCLDFISYMITNLDKIFDGTGKFFDWLFSVGATVFIAFVISYVFDPVVEFFQNKYDAVSEQYVLPVIKRNRKLRNFVLKKYLKKNKNDVPKYRKRTAGTTITFLIIIAVLYMAVNLLVNKLSGSDGNTFAEGSISFINSSVDDLSKTYQKLENFLKDYGVYQYLEGYINAFVREFSKFVSNIGNGIIDFIYSLGSGFLNILIGFVISFYFLRDKESIRQKSINVCNTFFPDRFNNILKNVLGDIDAVFSGYIRGQVIDASIMSVLIGTSLAIIDVDFALIIGIVSGFANIIPYFGACIAFVLAIIVTLLSGTPIKALYAGIIIIILQQLDGIVIGPKVVGDNVKLSPVMVIIALAVAAELFGLWGMVFAVPVVATFKLFAERFYQRQKLKKNNNSV